MPTFAPVTFDRVTFDPATFDPATFDPGIFDPGIFDPGIFGPGRPAIIAEAVRETAIRHAHERLLAIDDRYHPSVDEIAALAGTTPADVRRSMIDPRSSSTRPG